MKNITVTLDEKTAAWVRVHAAKLGKSVSRLLGEILHAHMREFRDYNEAMRCFQALNPRDFEWLNGQRPMREDLHDRSGLR